MLVAKEAKEDKRPTKGETKAPRFIAWVVKEHLRHTLYGGQLMVKHVVEHVLDELLSVKLLHFSLFLPSKIVIFSEKYRRKRQKSIPSVYILHFMCNSREDVEQQKLLNVKVYSPQILIDIAVEDRFLCPAEGEEGLADGGFDVGGDGAAAVVVLVVAFAGEKVNEAILDGTLQMMGHVVVHPFEAEWHTDWFVGTILGTIRVLHLRISEIDSGHDRIILGDIVLQDTAKAVFPDGAVLTLAYDTFCRHFPEVLFFCLFGGRGLA